MCDALLDEYRTLREELMLHMKHESQTLALSGTVFFAVMVFLCNLGDGISPEVAGIAPIVFLTPLFLLYRAEAFAVAKIASYIERFIESETTALRWTRAHSKARPKYWKECSGGSFAELDPHQVVGLYFVVLLGISWVTPVYLTGEWPSILALGVMALFTLACLVNFVVLLRYRSYRETWENVWDASYADLKAQEAGAIG